MKSLSVFPARRARIEIIPLIDIMFFLLASFMLASLALIRLQSIQMDLPTATVPAKSKPDVVDLLVKPDGDLYVGDTAYNIVDLQRFLSNRFRVNSHVQVYIKADPASTYGMFINALDLVRQVGIQNVSCAITLPPKSKQKG
jgi:biopolymer transport protein ExbD